MGPLDDQYVVRYKALNAALRPREPGLRREPSLAPPQASLQRPQHTCQLARGDCEKINVHFC